MSVISYKPIANLKRSQEMDKQKNLATEIRVMQHALQQYQVELTRMETKLFNSYQLAGDQLLEEERADVEVLQGIWAAVRKEVLEMEQLLARRLDSVMAGNDNFTPLDSLDVVKNMIDLLREQLYQHQMSLSRDINYDNDDGFLYLVSPARPSSSSSRLSPRSSPASKHCRSYLQSKSIFSELRDQHVEELKEDLHGNTEWLHLKLQSKNRQIQRLKMENFLHTIYTGPGRRR